MIGHSLGGFVALQLGATETRATVSVGLVSATTFSVIDSVRHPITRFAVLPGYTALLQVMRVLGRFGRAGRGLVRALDRMRLLRPLVAPLFSQPARIDGTVVAALATEARPRAFALASARAGRFDAERSWSRIRCPVRAIHGDSDVFVAATDRDRLGRTIDDFGALVIGGTGHFGHVERPYETLEVLLGRR